MLGDSLTFTYDGVSLTLPKISSEVNGKNILTTYRNSDSTLEVKVGHERQNPAFSGGPPRIRRSIIFTKFFNATDPLTAVVKKVQSSTQFIFNDLEWGIVDADLKKLQVGLSNCLAISGLVDKVLGDES